MRIAELSSITGVAVPSIKFYLREGLMAAGERTSRSQSTYTDSHVARLRLIRALVDVGGLPVAAVRDVLAAIDNTAMPLDQAFGIAQSAASRSASAPTGRPQAPPLPPPPPGQPTAQAEIADLLERTGWRVSPDNPGITLVERVLDTYNTVGHPEMVMKLDGYSAAALLVATTDLDAVALQSTREQMTEVVVVGTVLGDVLLAGLRRMAQEHVSHQRYSPPDGGQVAVDLPPAVFPPLG